MIVWIEKPLALAIHDRQLAEHGGGTGVRDEALLDSAVARPQQLFAYGDPPPDLAALAASLRMAWPASIRSSTATNALRTSAIASSSR
jgi:prophage maintenance system killer protein